MNTVSIDTSLLQYLISYLKTDHTKETPEFFESTWKVGIETAIPELEATLALRNQPSNESGSGYKQIQSNPNRTDVGQGPLLNANSEFI